MFAIVVATTFLMQPAPVVVGKQKFPAIPRFMQAGGIPGFAPPGLPDPPAVLNITWTAPQNRRGTMVAVYRAGPNGARGGWAVSSGDPVIYNPYHDSAPVSRARADGTIDQTAYGCFTQWGLVRVNTASPYQAGPNIWNQPFLNGWSITVSQ